MSFSDWFLHHYYPVCKKNYKGSNWVEIEEGQGKSQESVFFFDFALSKKKKTYRQRAQRGCEMDGGGKTKHGILSDEIASDPLGKIDNQSGVQRVSAQALESEDLADLIFKSAQDMGLQLTQNKEDTMKIIRDSLVDNTQDIREIDELS